MDLLTAELGERLTVNDVAAYLKVDARLVRKHYEKLGGVRLGQRRFIFFERRLINALLQQEKSQKTMDGSDLVERESQKEIIQDQERVNNMGGKRKKKESLYDGHGIFG